MFLGTADVGLHASSLQEARSGALTPGHRSVLWCSRASSGPSPRTPLKPNVRSLIPHIHAHIRVIRPRAIGEIEKSRKILLIWKNPLNLEKPGKIRFGPLNPKRSRNLRVNPLLIAKYSLSPVGIETRLPYIKNDPIYPACQTRAHPLGVSPLIRIRARVRAGMPASYSTTGILRLKSTIKCSFRCLPETSPDSFRKGRRERGGTQRLRRTRWGQAR